MKNTITTHLRALRQVSYVAVAGVLLVAILPLVSSGDALAGKQLAYRSIQMSDSSPSNGTVTPKWCRYVLSDGTSGGLSLQFQYPLGNRAASAIWARALLQRHRSPNP